MNSLIAEPPNSSRASSVRTTVRLVVIDRPNVCRMEWLTMSRERLAGVAGLVLPDPVEHDDGVVDAEADDRQHRGHEEGIDLDAEERCPRIAKTPTTTMTSWSSATSAVTPNFTSRKRYVIQSRIPIEPTRMSTSAWLMRSELTTGADRRERVLLGDRTELGLEGLAHLAQLPGRWELGVPDRCRRGGRTGAGDSRRGWPTRIAAGARAGARRRAGRGGRTRGRGRREPRERRTRARRGGGARRCRAAGAMPIRSAVPGSRPAWPTAPAKPTRRSARS